MNFGGGLSKKDLLEIIEIQKKQFFQYQVWFKDVVCVYKSLLKEKEVLEVSIKVLLVFYEVDVGFVGVQFLGFIFFDFVDDWCFIYSEDSIGIVISLDIVVSFISIKGEFGVEDDRLVCGLLFLKFEEVSWFESGVSSSSGDGLFVGGEVDKRLYQLKIQLVILISFLVIVIQEKFCMEVFYLVDKKKMKQDLEDVSNKVEEERVCLEGELKGLQE